YLYQQEKVRLVPIEITHPDLTKKFKVRPDGRLARGWYAWKPVALKQALDMYPYVFYLDSGMRVVGDMTLIFQLIQQEGYLLVESHEIRGMTTEKVRKLFNLEKSDRLLDAMGISAGVQGLTRAMYDSYIFPIYKLTFDFHWFED